MGNQRNGFSSSYIFIFHLKNLNSTQHFLNFQRDARVFCDVERKKGDNEGKKKDKDDGDEENDFDAA